MGTLLPGRIIMTVTKVVILQGTSGSGKSTWARQQPGSIIVSADHALVDPDGVYRFSPERQSEGHKRCLREYASLLLRRYEGSPEVQVIVDNTNTRALFMEPYVSLAGAFNIPVEILSFRAPADVCAARNNERAPMSVVKEMSETIGDVFHMPGHWERNGVTYRVIDTTRPS
jgi:predicted kinase